jgi:hypothetical protein
MEQLVHRSQRAASRTEQACCLMKNANGIKAMLNRIKEKKEKPSAQGQEGG